MSALEDNKQNQSEEESELKEPSDETNINDDAVPQQFEEIIESLGSFGPMQRMIFFIICLADVFGSLGVMLPVFTASTPAWVCVNGSTNASYTPEQGKCHNENYTCTKREYQDDFTSAVSQWDLVCEKSYVSDLITSIQMGGLLVGASFGGQISDTYGRKVTYFATYVLLIVPGFVSAFSTSWQMFAVCRFLVGAGYGSQQTVNCVYPLEFIGRRWRVFCGTVGFWAAGIMILALAAFILRDWRHLTVATSAIGIVYFAAWWILPESPRWLIQKKRFEEAHLILLKIARRNKRRCPDVSVLRKLYDNDAKGEALLNQYSFLDLFTSWHYTKVTLASLVTWFSSCIIYYHLSFSMRTYSGDRYLNVFIAGVVDFLVMISVIPLCTMGGATIGLTNAGTCSGVLGGSELGILTLVSALIGRSCALGGLYVCQIHAAEMYPTVIRNIGVGVSSMAARIGSIIAPQIAFLGTMNAVAPSIISTVLCVLAVSCVLTLPETKDRALQDQLFTTKQPINDKCADKMNDNISLSSSANGKIV